MRLNKELINELKELSKKSDFMVITREEEIRKAIERKVSLGECISACRTPDIVIKLR